MSEALRPAFSSASGKASVGAIGKSIGAIAASAYAEHMINYFYCALQRDKNTDR